MEIWTQYKARKNSRRHKPQKAELQNKFSKERKYYNQFIRVGILFCALCIHAGGVLAQQIPAKDLVARADSLVAIGKVQVAKDSLTDYAEVLGELSDVYISIGDSLKALKTAEEATAIYQKESGEWSEGYAISLGWQAKVWFMRENYNKARELWLKTIDIWDQIHYTDKENYLSVYYSIAITYRKQEKDRQALSYYDKIYELYPDPSQADGTVQDILDEACIYANDLNAYERIAKYGIKADWIGMYLKRQQDVVVDFSVQNLIQAINIIFEESYYPGDIVFLRRLASYIPELRQLADLYATKGIDRCYELTLRCMHTMIGCIEKKTGKNSSEYVWGLSRHALCLLRNEQVSEARSKLKEAVQILEKILESNPTNDANELYLCVMTNYLATVAETPEDYKQLDQQYKLIDNRLNALEGKSWMDSLKLAEVCLNMMPWYREMGRMQKADQLYQTSFEIYSRLCNNFHPLWVRILGYSDVFQQADSSNLSLFKFQLEFNKTYYGECHLAVARAYNNLTTWYSNTAQSDLSIDAVKKSYGIYKKFYGEEHPYTISALAGVIDILIAFAKYEEANIWQQQLLNVVEKVYGKNSCKYVYYLVWNSERLAEELGDKEVFLTTLDEIQELTGKIQNPSIEYAEVLSLICQLYAGMSLWDKAVEYQVRALEIYVSHWGENTDYAKQLQVLVKILADQGNLKEAERVGKQSINILKKISGESSELYWRALSGLANIQMKNGNLESGVNNIRKMVEVVKNIEGDTTALYGEGLGMLADAYRQIHQLEKARNLLDQSEKLTAGFLESNIDYGDYYQYFVDFYVEIKDWKKAEKYAFMALQSSRSQYKGEFIGQYDILNKIAFIYECQNQFDKAEQYTVEAVELMKKIRGEYSFDYLRALNDQLRFMKSIGAANLKEIAVINQMLQIIGYQCSLSDNNEVLRIKLLSRILPDLEALFSMYLMNNNLLDDPAFKENGGKQSDFYKNILQGVDQLGGLLLDIKKKYETLPEWKGRYKSDPGYRDILRTLGNFFQYCKKDLMRSRVYLTLYAANCQEEYTIQSAPYAMALYDLSILARESGQQDQALTLILKAVKIIEEIQDHEKLVGVPILQVASDLCRKAGQMELAVEYALRRYGIIRQQVHVLFDVMSEYQREAFLNKYGNGSENILSLLPVACSSLLAGQAYDASLYTKGLLLRSWNRIKESVYASKDQYLIDHLYQIDSLKDKLQGMASDFSEQGLQQKNEISGQLEMLDKEMVLQSKTYRQAMLQQTVSWRDIRKGLTADRAAVEFIVSDSLYGALILTTKDSFPDYVPLFRSRDLTDLLKRLENFHIHEKIRRLYTHGDGFYGEELYRMVWQPLEKYLKDIHHIDYSPIGMLHHISFAAIQSPEGTCLSEQFELNLLSSTSEIVVPSSGMETGDGVWNACVYGGIYYDEQQPTLVIPQEYRGAVKKAIGWNYLPQSEKEVRNITEELKHGKIETRLYTGYEANERAFKAMDGCAPNIIHLATHGFYLENETEIKDSKYLKNYGIAKYNSMLRSGIVLAEANNAWTGKQFADSAQDGVLTADEIAKLNLSHTYLAVLSACETGLGDVDQQEGVMGLQRAFKQAGVRQLVMSLWQVDDRVTSEMMTLFYQYLRENRKVKEAFWLSLGSIRKKYPDPFYWGAFILLD